MSRTPSSVSSQSLQVATKPTSGIYTLLLVIATAALVATAVYSGMVLDARYGFVLPFGAAYDKAKGEPAAAKAEVAGISADLKADAQERAQKAAGGTTTETPKTDTGTTTPPATPTETPKTDTGTTAPPAETPAASAAPAS
jgi:hypothetical protein